MTEAPSTAVFACAKYESFSKANELMKIETVKPMPASMPTAKICRQFTELGSWAKRQRTATLEKPRMPKAYR